jgi:hypothetical protein
MERSVTKEGAHVHSNIPIHPNIRQRSGPFGHVPKLLAHDPAAARSPSSGSPDACLPSTQRVSGRTEVRPRCRRGRIVWLLGKPLAPQDFAPWREHTAGQAHPPCAPASEHNFALRARDTHAPSSESYAHANFGSLYARFSQMPRGFKDKTSIGQSNRRKRERGALELADARARLQDRVHAAQQTSIGRRAARDAPACDEEDEGNASPGSSVHTRTCCGVGATLDQ